MQDWQGFLKIDNATTLDFLTSYAGALCQDGELSERALDQFKVSLAAMMASLQTGDTTVMSVLREHESEFLELLAARYGTSGLAWNHLRFTARSVLSESCARLAMWADNSLKKAELFMNRPYLAEGSLRETRRELFPSVLIHVAKTLHDAARDVRETVLALSVMRPADILDTSGRTRAIEEKIAIAVGFAGLETESLAYCRAEIKALRKVAVTFDELSTSMMEIIAGIRANTLQASKSKELEIEMEFFAAECQRLNGTRFEMSHNLDVWEARRLGFLFEIFQLNQRMTNLARLFVESLAPRDKFDSAALLSSDVERAITCALVRTGTPIRGSLKASKDLMDYCRAHKVTPATMIPAELKKINQELRQETLDLASELTSDTVTATPGGLEEKSRFMEAAKKLRKSLNVTVPFSATMGIALLVSLMNFSCGVKTMVVSDKLDPRPEVPYKAAAPEIKKQEVK